MECPKCQFENPEEMQFCVKCGNKLEINCPECGFGNSPTFQFCGKCGHDLNQPAETPAINLNQPQSYTPKFLADKILNNRSAIEGERKLVTVLLSESDKKSYADTEKIMSSINLQFCKIYCNLLLPLLILISTSFFIICINFNRISGLRT